MSNRQYKIVEELPRQNHLVGRPVDYDFTCDKCKRFNMCFGKPPGCWYCGALPPYAEEEAR